MDVKYSPLGQNDPDTKALDFTSAFTYDYPKYFSYGKHSNKYRSAFTYDGFDPNFKKDSVDSKEATPMMRFCAALITIICYILMILTLPVSWWFCVKRVPQYERLVVFRIGRLLSTKGPGMVLILPCIDKYQCVDLRVKGFSIPPQVIMTTDGGSVEMGAEVLHHVKDSVRIINNVQDVNNSMRDIAKTSLQRHLSKSSISEIESNKVFIQGAILKDLNQVVLTWGVEITKVEFSTMKVLMEPNDKFANQGANSALQVLGQLFMPQGQSSGPPSMQQLATHLQFPGAPQQGGGFSVDQLASQFQFGGGPSVNGPQLVPPKPEAGDHLSTEVTAAQMQGRNRKKYQSAFDLLEAVQPHLNSQLVQEFQTVYKFVVTGKDGATFYLDLKNAPGSANLGEPPLGEPDVTLTLNSRELKNLLNEETTPFSAYMMGKLSVDGDTALASKLSDLIEIVNK